MIPEGDTRYKKMDGSHTAAPMDFASMGKAAALLLCGCGLSLLQSRNRGLQLTIIATLATAMRAANVADFYMTKYQSKAQEMLGPVIQPFIAGMRRIAQAESEPDAAQSKTITLARKRIRRFIFSANHTVWYSACELAVFLRTGCTCVRTEPTTKVFSGKSFAMMHECKRLLNHATTADGLLVAQISSHATKASSMDTFAVPAPASDTDGESSQPDEEGCPSSGAAHNSSAQTSLQSPRKKHRSTPHTHSDESDAAEESDEGSTCFLVGYFVEPSLRHLK